MAHRSTNPTWQDYPSTATKVTAATLENLEGAVDNSVVIAGDLGGTPAAPVVAKVNGVAVTGTPTSGQVPVASSGTAATWGTPSTTVVSDATSTVKGILQLANDLGGTAAAPVVSRINGVAVTGTPSAGMVPTATSGTAATWQSPGGATGSVFLSAHYAGASVNLAASTFTTYPIDTVDTNVGGGTFNTSTYIYTVPKAGLYLIVAGIRIQDNTATRNVAVGVDTSNADGPQVHWANMGNLTANGLRDSRIFTRIARFALNDPVRLFIYSDGAVFPTQYSGAPSAAGQFLTLCYLSA